MKHTNAVFNHVVKRTPTKTFICIPSSSFKLCNKTNFSIEHLLVPR